MGKTRARGSIDIDDGVIRAWATKNGIALEEISVAIGRSHGFLSQRMGYGYMHREDAEKISELTGISMDDLTGKTAIIEEAKRTKATAEVVERIVEVEKIVEDPLRKKLKRLVADRWVDGETSISIKDLMVLLNGEDGDD